MNPVVRPISMTVLATVVTGTPKAVVTWLSGSVATFISAPRTRARLGSCGRRVSVTGGACPGAAAGRVRAGRPRIHDCHQARVPSDQRAGGDGMEPARVAGHALEPPGRRVDAACDGGDLRLRAIRRSWSFDTPRASNSAVVASPSLRRNTDAALSVTSSMVSPRGAERYTAFASFSGRFVPFVLPENSNVRGPTGRGVGGHGRRGVMAKPGCTAGREAGCEGWWARGEHGGGWRGMVGARGWPGAWGWWCEGVEWRGGRMKWWGGGGARGEAADRAGCGGGLEGLLSEVQVGGIP